MFARWFAPSEVSMPYYVGLDVSQKTTAICFVDEQDRRLRRGVCATDPGKISARVLKHSGVDAKVGVETCSMTPWLVHSLRSAGLDVQCLDARRMKAALQVWLNKTGENDAEGLAQIMPTGWYRAVHEVPRCTSRELSSELVPSSWA
jgi:transposase